MKALLHGSPGLLLLPLLLAPLLLAACTSTRHYGLFQKAGDVGAIGRAGSSAYDRTTDSYRLTGSGANIWGTTDAFHFLWREVDGDLRLTTEVAWEGAGRHEHRKAGWMVRQSLAPDAPYADAVVHGDGLISLQYRRVVGGPTLEVRSPIAAPASLRLERDGDQFTLSVARPGGPFQPVGTVSVPMTAPVLAGLALTSHDDTALETAILSKVELTAIDAVPERERIVESTLEIVRIDTGERRIVYRARRHFEAPNWSRDGRYLLFNSEGRLFTIPTTGGEPRLLDTGHADRCNNDHGFSPDGTQLAISHSPANQSLIYVLPAAGGAPRLVTEKGPSYWHGWSPDGLTLAYCAERDGNFDIYTIPVAGGAETRLTTADGLDDGPDYSPDGRYIYFNSVRTGQMKIWRMRTDGSEQIQLTPTDDYGDWFAHPSPDGRTLAFISYDKSVEGHPPNKDVVIRTMSADGGEPRVLVTLYGGQGTLNVPSWSPDGKELAFVSYRLVTP